MFKTLRITNDTDFFTTIISRFTGKTAIRKGPGSIMTDFCPNSLLLDFSYINWRNVQIKNVVNNVDMSS